MVTVRGPCEVVVVVETVVALDGLEEELSAILHLPASSCRPSHMYALIENKGPACCAYSLP